MLRIIELEPEAVILDITALDSFSFAKSLGTHLPAVKIVAFAVREFDDQVLACAEAGIVGYVGPDGSEDDLVTAIEHALRGELYCSPRMAALLFRQVGALSAQLPPEPGPVTLTQREQQILVFIDQGLSNKEIARVLRIGATTVKNHVHNILEKLHVHRRGEAAAQHRASQHRFHQRSRQAVERNASDYQRSY